MSERRRVHQVAASLGVGSRVVLDALEGMGVNGLSASSRFPEERLIELQKLHQPSPPQTRADANTERTQTGEERRRWQADAPLALTFVDTSFLMAEGAERALEDEFLPLLTETSDPLIVPFSCVKEMQRHLGADAPPQSRARAEAGLRLLARLREQGSARAIGSERDDPFADPILLGRIQLKRAQRHIILLTQDRNLADDVRNQAQQTSVKSRYRTHILRVTDQGLRPVPRLKGGAARIKTTRPPAGARFTIATGPAQPPGVPLHDARPPNKGEDVRTRLGDLRLLEVVLEGHGRGSQGTVFRTSNPDLVCKVFHQGVLTTGLATKLHRMLEADPELPGVAWPLSDVWDEAGNVVGFVMPLAPGRPMSRQVFLTQPLLRRQPSWTRRNLVSISRSAADTVARLHEIGVIIGDLSGNNALVDDAGESVVFVDADSFQIEAFPCPVGTPGFLSADLEGVDLATRLRTRANDEFALAVLLFMTLMLGKSPYSQTGDGDHWTRIRERAFPYHFGGSGKGAHTPGRWPMVWSNLPHRTKKAFHAAFADGTPPTASEWVKILDAYAFDLQNGHSTEELMPSAYKAHSAHAAARFGGEVSDRRLVHVDCEECGDSIKTYEDEVERRRVGGRILCRSCNSALARSLICSDCGATFKWTASSQAKYREQSWSAPTRCSACRDSRQKITCDRCGHVMNVKADEVNKLYFQGRHLCGNCSKVEGDYLTCADCRGTFLFSLSDQRFYASRDLSAPRRCKPCRAAKRR